jgi:hypothetical protein
LHALRDELRLPQWTRWFLQMFFADGFCRCFLTRFACTLSNLHTSVAFAVCLITLVSLFFIIMISGGKVAVHVDSTFLDTDPPSVIGLWVGSAAVCVFLFSSRAIAFAVAPISI